MSLYRFLLGLFCGGVAAGLSTWLTSNTLLIAAVGIMVSLSVWTGLVFVLIGEDD